MGPNKRRRIKENTEPCSLSGIGAAEGSAANDGVLYYLESDVPSDDTLVSPAWSCDLVQKIDRKQLSETFNSENIPQLTDIGMFIVRGTLDRMEKQKHKKAKKKNFSTSSSVNKTLKPTNIQLRIWPALLESYESKALNVVGIAPTGTGKTMAYAIPMISLCVRNLLAKVVPSPVPMKSASPEVHGIVLAPTRELAIQVSKECKVAAKVANKLLVQLASSNELEKGNATQTIWEVEAIPVYGGVDIQSQIAQMGFSESQDAQSNLGYRSLVIVATPGRLLDLLKNEVDYKNGTAPMKVSSAFANVQTVVFDEADRIAINSEMAQQVDDILSIVKEAKLEVKCAESNVSHGIVFCSVSATLPQKAKEMCEKWIQRPRVVVKVDSVKVGGKQPAEENATEITENEESPEICADGCAPTEGHQSSSDHPAKKLPEDLDLASIPAHLVQTLHVCSNHKKPRKLIVTLQKIYAKPNNSRDDRSSTNKQLCIVFFSQIKTVKYVAKLLQKEGLRYVEFYGKLNQSEREARLLEFKCGKIPILLSTDIAARGIHVSNVHYVINYDFPSSLDQYVHRCGRAGRKQLLSGETSENPPTVFSFFPREFSPMADSVIELLTICKAWVDPNLLALSSTKSTNVSGKKRRRKKNSSTAEVAAVPKPRSSNEDQCESDNDPFSFLNANKIVLKRASHVSDADDSDDESV